MRCMEPQSVNKSVQVSEYSGRVFWSSLTKCNGKPAQKRLDNSRARFGSFRGPAFHPSTCLESLCEQTEITILCPSLCHEGIILLICACTCTYIGLLILSTSQSCWFTISSLEIYFLSGKGLLQMTLKVKLLIWVECSSAVDTSRRVDRALDSLCTNTLYPGQN